MEARAAHVQPQACDTWGRKHEAVRTKPAAKGLLCPHRLTFCGGGPCNILRSKGDAAPNAEAMEARAAHVQPQACDTWEGKT
jgi:iron-sulfur cluster repair protein YtfE (RIC family)